MSQHFQSRRPIFGNRALAFPDGAAAGVLQFERSPRHTFAYGVLKRALDLFIILLFSPIILLVIAIIAASVSFGSPGPVFFSHRRIDRHGSFFSMWKFRTMVMNGQHLLEEYFETNPEAREEWRATQKLKNDPRVTPIGNFLRRTSLDELPQLWNVFIGDMSLVGPRPIVAAEVEKYGPYFADYCLVKPGVTGLWQISGRSETTYQERIELDRQYAHTWTLSGDIRILFKTLSTVIKQRGAV
jgi:lipopolysaccharide/colanic/teichoic acid biosynthesis glycosyltransferase